MSSCDLKDRSGCKYVLLNFIQGVDSHLGLYCDSVNAYTRRR